VGSIIKADRDNIDGRDIVPSSDIANVEGRDKVPSSPPTFKTIA
jgi:hypothetical protein